MNFTVSNAKAGATSTAAVKPAAMQRLKRRIKADMGSPDCIVFIGAACPSRCAMDRGLQTSLGHGFMG
jgi:hypothetical protein